jgi:hypothetical protein
MLGLRTTRVIYLETQHRCLYPSIFYLLQWNVWRRSENVSPENPPHTFYVTGTLITDAGSINPVARQPEAHLI